MEVVASFSLGQAAPRRVGWWRAGDGDPGLDSLADDVASLSASVDAGPGDG
jgi:hypothetical protein